MPQAEFFFAAALHTVELVIGSGQEFFYRSSIIWINGYTGANRHGRFLAVTREPFADSQRGFAGFLFA